MPDVDRTKVTIKDDDRAQRIGAGFTIRDSFGRCNIVPDVDRYRLQFDNHRIALFSHSECQIKPSSNRYYDHLAGKRVEEETTIVIVLESPHEEEYLCNLGQPITAAQGSAGSNVQGWLDDVLRGCPALHRKLKGGQPTRVILSNPVQFQASLVSVIDCSKQDKKKNPAWRRVRDAVWKALWNHQVTTDCRNCKRQTTNDAYPIRDCFKARLGDLEPDHIINACTSNTPTMKEMKESISRFLANEFPCCGRYEVSHPSGWSYEENRKLRRRSPCTCTCRCAT